MCILRAEHLCKSYSSSEGILNILDHVCFQMKQGEKVAVVGPSGSGKTTFLHTLCGIDRPDFGIIQIQDEELSEMSDDAFSLFRRKYFGMIFQDFQLLESLNVKENILLPLILAGRGEGEQKRCLQQVTSAVGIEKLLDKGITEISGGQKQRVAIARAFIHRPALIFADEPTGNLDRKATTDVIKCMIEMSDNYQTSELIVTHDLYIASFCDRVLMLKDGNFTGEIYKQEKDFEKKIMSLMFQSGGGCE